MRASAARQPVRDQAGRSPGPGPPAGSGRRPRSCAGARARSPARSARRCCSGITGSESAHSISVGRRSSRSASSTRWPAAAPGPAGVVGISSGKARAPALDAGGVRRFVGGDHLVAGVALAPPRTSIPTGRSSVRATKSRNASHASVMRWCPVNRPESMITSRCDALGLLDRHAQPDRPSPVVHDHRRAAQIELLEQRPASARVALVAVPVDVDRLVRAPEPGEIGRHAAKAGVAHRGDHVAPQKRPRRLAVDEHHRSALRPRRGARAAARPPRGRRDRTGSPAGLAGPPRECAPTSLIARAQHILSIIG